MSEEGKLFLTLFGGVAIFAILVGGFIVYDKHHKEYVCLEQKEVTPFCQVFIDKMKAGR